MSMLGPGTWWWMRLAIVAAALSAYLLHIWPHFQRQVIGAPLGDTPDVLLEHQDRVYHFLLRTPSQDDGLRSIGSVRQRMGFSDTFYIIDSTFRLHRDHQLPQLMALNTWGIDSTVRMDMRLEIDDRWRPVGIAGNLRFARTIIDIIGAFSHNGLEGHIVLSQDERTPFQISQLGGTQLLAFHPALALPAGLTLGDRFSLPSIGATATPPFLTTTTLSFVVEAEETIRTAAGSMPCLRLGVFHHGQSVVSIWVDQQGIIYRIGDDQALIQAHLEHITNQAGDPLWPTQELP